MNIEFVDGRVKFSIEGGGRSWLFATDNLQVDNDIFARGVQVNSDREIAALQDENQDLREQLKMLLDRITVLEQSRGNP